MSLKTNEICQNFLNWAGQILSTKPPGVNIFCRASIVVAPPPSLQLVKVQGLAFASI